MRKLTNKSGFTLIEIIVVLIIVGILAAIALPNLFSNVTRSGSGEALAALSPDKDMVEGCIMGHPGAESDNCSTITFANTANFTYALAGLTDNKSGGDYTITATNDTASADTITFTKDYKKGLFTCSGASDYLGVC